MNSRLILCLTPFFALLLLLTGCETTQDEFVGVDGDFVTGSPLPERREGVSFMSGGVSRNQFEPIYFSYDSFDVPASESGKIQIVADFLKSSPNDVIIAGFTDDRGTEEYNRVLGERRALAVRDALIMQGISGQRLQTVSFGEELPAVPGSGESAYSKNRRAEFGIVQ